VLREKNPRSAWLLFAKTGAILAIEALQKNDQRGIPMEIYFHEKFKQLRKARDLTQEQIANTFNVSPQTVSRWETGVNLPDIEMLPPLAAFFKVTVDDLLGVDLAHRQAKARQFREAIHEKYRADLPDEAIAIARDAVAALPNDYGLLSWLAQAL